MRLEELKVLDEAQYVGNIGMMEMFKFFSMATPEQKAKMKDLLFKGEQEQAWKFMQEVTGLKLN